MEGPKDDFKWFGEGFDGFPRRLPDDTVEYTLLIIDSKLTSQKEIVARLEAVRKESLKLCEELLRDYIWQRDPFKLELHTGKGVVYLHGQTNYGDSVDDEWLIVYILRELSTRFPELWVRVTDTDGEFLLIEAANALPRWLNPEIADNRVWINKGSLHIISPSPNTGSSTTEVISISRSLSFDKAREIICFSPEMLVHSPLIEAEAFYRLRNYPAQIKESLHYAPVTIPRKLAYILHERPASIAPAVEAFYLRDPIALKPLNGTKSDLIFPPDDLVTVSVRFTKVLYAQLRSQRFPPPDSWKEIFSPPKLSASSTIPPRKIHDQLETGMKLACGFEMLLQDTKSSDNRLVREIKILLDDLDVDGDLSLPSDSEILTWADASRADDETWLNINFEDFEKELQGKAEKKVSEKSSEGKKVFGPERPPGFGDARTQADLKKIVERFEAFMNDDEAGVEGAELDEMDFDDDDDNDDDEDSEEEDKAISFDEEEFTRMMKEMMGIPSAETNDPGMAKPTNNDKLRDVESDEEQSEKEEEEIRKLMEGMEAELKAAGALNLDPPSNKQRKLKEKSPEVQKNDAGPAGPTEDDSDAELDIDFNLAKNLLESFKSQGGMAGPGGNLLGMMGMQLPRDEDDASPATNVS
ncbi:SGT1 protein-domain-containing protein [Xylogone sp. PMI_703]|nr:SGT1 protein-domain-containing protein [Xylogone sp. PMI_703]